MPTPNDLIEAKEWLSEKLLSATVAARGAGLRRSRRIADVVAMAGSNVHAVGIGRKIVNGKETDTMAVRIYLVHKIAASALDSKHKLPSEINGIPIDVIEAPLAHLAGGIGAAPACTLSRRQTQRPVIAGVSTGHPDVGAGTIGYFCRSTRPGDDPTAVYVLSNNHIFANLNQAKAGDPLYQAGPLDGGTAADAIATLSRWVDLETDGQTANSVDCALGAVSAGVQYSVECCSIGVVAGTAQAVAEMPIRKHGRTTGYAEGKVSDVSATALVALDPNNPQVLLKFTNQLLLSPAPGFPSIGGDGDSGALVVDAGSQNAIGLYFANPEGGAFAYANPIGAVLTELQIELA